MPASTESFAYKSRSELQKEAYYYTKRFLLESLRDNQIDGNIKFIEHEKEPVGAYIALQLWYNKDTHKAFIEYDLNYVAEVNYNTSRVKETFEWKMKNQFHFETYMWYEFLNPEDGVHEDCDSNALLTPFTIGYWKSLSGRYEFVEDDTEIYADATNYMNPSDEIRGGAPTKRFYGPTIGTNKSWCTIVAEIRDRYKQTYLSEEKKNQYIETVNAYARAYGRNSTTFKTKVNELKNSMGIITNVSANVPSVFSQYNTAYTNFFGRALNHNINSEKKLVYLQIVEKEKKIVRYGNGI